MAAPPPARIRVLQLITSLPYGGAERLVVSAAAGLPPDRFESAICCFTGGGPLAEDAERAGVSVWSVGAFPGMRHPGAFARLIRIIRTFQPDLVHTHLQAPNVYGRLAALAAGVPSIVATEHNVYASKPRRYIVAERLLAPRTTALLAVSETVAAFLGRQLRVPQSSIQVLRNGVARPVPSPAVVEAFRRQLGGGSSIRIATVASLTPKKGHEFLVRAVAALKARGFDCVVALAGEGPERPKLEALARELNVDDRLTFVGALRNVADLLAAVDLFVLPSLVEGLPLALLEAMAAGTPVIATSVGGVPEVIRNGVNGLLVNPGDAEELATAIVALADSPAQRRRLAVAAHATVDAGYTESAYLASLAAIYERAVARSHAGS